VSEPQQGIFGIDLGTTYSVVGYIDETGRAAVTRNSYGEDTTPSVVFFENEGNVAVGTVAKDTAGLYPDQVVSLIKREMGDREYRRTFFGVEHTPPSISAIILKALAKDAEMTTGRKVTDVVITVPAYFGLLEKDATRQAGQIAGLNVIGIVPEPVAAALQYGVTGNADGTTFLVYDLGGGTFDISLIQMTEDSVEVLVVGGDAGPHSIGLYAAGLAVALGASRVAYLDRHPGRLAIAAALGAMVIDGPAPRKAGAFPITVDASGAPEGLRCALNSTAADGTCTSASVYLEDPAVPMFAMYSRCCTLHAGRAHARPAIPAVLDLVAAGFDPSLVTSAVVTRADAADALTRPPMKLVIDCATDL